MRLSLRYVDVQITEPHAVGDSAAPPLVDPPQEFEIADGGGENIVAVNQWRTYTGTLGTDETLYARVWISVD